MKDADALERGARAKAESSGCGLRCLVGIVAAEASGEKNEFLLRTRLVYFSAARIWLVERTRPMRGKMFWMGKAWNSALMVDMASSAKMSS